VSNVRRQTQTTSLPRPVANGTLVAQAESLCYGLPVTSIVIHQYLTLDLDETDCKPKVSNESSSAP